MTILASLRTIGKRLKIFASNQSEEVQNVSEREIDTNNEADEIGE